MLTGGSLHERTREEVVSVMGKWLVWRGLPLITTLCLWKLNLFIWPLLPWGHRAGRATGPSVLAKQQRCDYDITYCTSSKRHHFWERLTRATRRGKCRGSFALPVTGRGYGKSLILCVLAVIWWVLMCVFFGSYYVSVFMCCDYFCVWMCVVQVRYIKPPFRSCVWMFFFLNHMHKCPFAPRVQHAFSLFSFWTEWALFRSRYDWMEQVDWTSLSRWNIITLFDCRWCTVKVVEDVHHAEGVCPCAISHHKS